jgi:sugar-specific transcriptional regulator TrmB
MNITTIITALENLGFKKNESAIYLTCLNTASGLRVHEMSKQSGINRSTALVTANRLLQKGYLSSQRINRHVVYLAAPPKQILQRLELTATKFRELLPTIQELIDKPGTVNRARFALGRNQVKHLYDECLLATRKLQGSNQEILAISASHEVLTLFPEHRTHFINRRSKERIPVKLIAPRSPIAEKLRLSGSREYRTVKLFDPKHYRLQGTIGIVGDMVGFADLDTQGPIACVIESPSVAKAMKTVFTMLWNSMPKNAS